MQNKKLESRNQKYQYQMLDRLKSDCDYYLGYGNRHPQALWAGNEGDQISKMREIWNNLEEKPEWLTWEDINDYADKMGVVELPSTRDNTAKQEIQGMLDRNYNKEKKVGIEESIKDGLEVLNQTEEEQTALKPVDFVYVYQLVDPGECGYGFMSYDYAKDKLNLDDYKLTAKVPLDGEYSDVNEILEYVFAYGNSNKEYYMNNPKARSISVSDILGYKNKNYYVDSFGFVELNLDEKLTEADINTNSSNEDLAKTKDEIQKQLNDVEEIATMKKELDDKVNSLFEENKKSDYRNDEETMVNYYNNITNKLGHYDFRDLDIKFTNTFLTVVDGIEHFTIEIITTHKAADEDITKIFNVLEEDILPEYMKVFYNVKDFKVILFDDSGKTSEIEKIFNNKNLSNKEIKEESQVSNYTLEEIGQCLKDKGNDFKLQITGADSKTKWLNIDKDDVQKIYNALSYKKKKTEDINPYTGIELSDSEEAQLDSLLDRNLKDEFNSLSKEAQQEYLDCIPENKKGLDRAVVNELAKRYNLDSSLLYWVVNIRDEKIEESKKKIGFPSSEKTATKLSYSDIKEVYDTEEKFKNIFTNAQLKWLILNDFDVNELYAGLKELLSTFRNESFKDVISIDEYINELNGGEI